MAKAVVWLQPLKKPLAKASLAASLNKATVFLRPIVLWPFLLSQLDSNSVAFLVLVLGYVSILKLTDMGMVQAAGLSYVRYSCRSAQNSAFRALSIMIKISVVTSVILPIVGGFIITTIFFFLHPEFQKSYSQGNIYLIVTLYVFSSMTKQFYSLSYAIKTSTQQIHHHYTLQAFTNLLFICAELITLFVYQSILALAIVISMISLIEILLIIITVNVTDSLWKGLWTTLDNKFKKLLWIQIKKGVNFSLLAPFDSIFFQALNIVIFSQLGDRALVYFTSLRTLSGVFTHLFQLLSMVITPILQYRIYDRNGRDSARAVSRIKTRYATFSILIGIAGFTLFALYSDQLLFLWIKDGFLEVDQKYVYQAGFGLSIFLSAFWRVNKTLFHSMNKPEVLFRTEVVSIVTVIIFGMIFIGLGQWIWILFGLIIREITRIIMLNYYYDPSSSN